MIRNYIKIAVRNILKYKSFSLINVLGLAIGMATCLGIYIYVSYELSYDNYHNDLDRIYRVVQIEKSEQSTSCDAVTAPALAPAIKESLPEVEASARIWPRSNIIVSHEEKVFHEKNMIFADNEILDILTIPFIRGNSGDALVRPNTVIITEELAQKYFGTIESIGKTLEMNQIQYEVTGILRNTPQNTHLPYDMFASISTYEGRNFLNAWLYHSFYTYIKIKPNVNITDFQNKLLNLGDMYAKDIFEEYGLNYTFHIRGVKDLYFYPNVTLEPGLPAPLLYLYIFSAVGILILIIAVINFINLSTARSISRAREVGLRKVVGAGRWQLIGQFLLESIILSFISLIAVVFLIELSLPVISDIAGVKLTSALLFDTSTILVISLIFIFTGLLGGIYPAFVQSRFAPTTTLKGNFSASSKGSFLRKCLVIAQFAVSVILIFGTIVIYNQLDFMMNQDMGFNKEQKLIVPIRRSRSFSESYEQVKDEFLSNPKILNASASSDALGDEFSSFFTSLIGKQDNREQTILHIVVDADFVPQYKINVIAGRNFNNEMMADTAHTFLINKSCLKNFGFVNPQDAIGERIITGYGNRDGEIIGVVDDFNFEGLQNSIKPLILFYYPPAFDHLNFMVSTNELSETISFIENKYKQIFPDKPFEYFFLDKKFEDQYRSEARAVKLLSVFSILGIFVASLGLFGLTLFITGRRIKEIGIRKVLGGSVTHIVLLLTKDFTKWVVLANIIALPIAYYLMSKWIQDFAYRTSIGIGVFVVSAMVVLFIAILTVCFQAFKAASTNPADSLRYE